MTKKSITFCTLALILLAAAYVDASSLVQNSPFLPPFYKKAATEPIEEMSFKKSDNTRFVLKGISRIGSHYHFSIYDSKTKKGRWVEAGTQVNDFSITSYDPKTRTISYRWNGHECTLQLANADNVVTPLTFFSTEGSAIAGQSSPLRAATLDASPQVYQSQRSGRNRISVLSNSAELSRQSLQTIFFDSRTYQPDPSGITNTTSADLGHNGFASNDSFADPELQAPVENIVAREAEPQQRFKISRRNNVSNANGKKPDHMTWTAWTELKNSQ
jgi:hypothetical protein